MEPKREFCTGCGPSVTAKARTARLAGAEWGFRGPRERRAGVWGRAPRKQGSGRSPV